MDASAWPGALANPGARPRARTALLGLLRRRWALALLLVLALAALLRLALVACAPTFLIVNDSGDFAAAGYQLATSGDFPLRAKRAPLYPLFLAGVFATAGADLAAVARAQHLLGLASVVLVYALGALLAGRGVGLLAALGTAISGALLVIEQTVASEALFAPLLPAALLLLLLGLRADRRLALPAGLLLGLCALTRPGAQAVLPLALAAALLEGRSWRQRLAATGLVLLGFLLVVGPWLIRQRAVHGIGAISSGLGGALYARTHDHDPSFTYRLRNASSPDRRWNALQNRVIELSRRNRTASGVVSGLRREFGLSEPEADRVLQAVALQIIRQEPERYARGTLAMFSQLLLGIEKRMPELWRSSRDPEAWRSWPPALAPALEANARPARPNPALAGALVALQDQRAGPLIGLLLLLGALRCARRGAAAAILPLVVLSQLLLYAALDGALARYRAQFQPLITLLLAVGLATGGQWLVSAARWAVRRWRPTRASEQVAAG